MAVETVSVPQAAVELGISRGLAFRLAREGRLPALQLGKRLVIPIRALEQMLARPDGWRGEERRGGDK